MNIDINNINRLNVKSIPGVDGISDSQAEKIQGGRFQFSFYDSQNNVTERGVADDGTDGSVAEGDIPATYDFIALNNTGAPGAQNFIVTYEDANGRRAGRPFRITDRRPEVVPSNARFVRIQQVAPDPDETDSDNNSGGNGGGSCGAVVPYGELYPCGFS